jgi:hypothetical protein
MAMQFGCQHVATQEKPEVVDQIGPEETAKQFLFYLHNGRPDDAFRMFAINEKMSAAFVEDERGDLERISQPATAGTWRLEFVDVHTQGPAAVAVINESIKRGKPAFDLDPLYMVYFDDQWWVVPGMTRHGPASAFLPDEEYAIFDVLEKWFQQRKMELNEAN